MRHRRWRAYRGCYGVHGWRMRPGVESEPTEEDIEALEEYQRDLEQAAADVAEQIRRLRERTTETV